MFINNFYNSPALMFSGNAHTNRLYAALNRYRQLQAEGRLGRALAALMGRSTALKNLEKVTDENRVASRRRVGLRSVPLNQICGSEGRTKDFDRHFNPLRSHTRQRWLSVMAARWTDVPLPPVELIRIGDAYFVRDGHHRISVAHALGESCIDAEVTAWELAEPAAAAAAARVRLPNANLSGARS